MNCQDHLHRRQDPGLVSRRWFLEQCGVSLGTMALRDLLGVGAAGAATPAGVNPLAARAPHFAPKAKRVIFLFMAGGPSHLEMFDNKPQLAKFDGTLPPAELLKGYRAAFINPDAKLLGPKFKFARHGQSGTEVSELRGDGDVLLARTKDELEHGYGRGHNVPLRKDTAGAVGGGTVATTTAASAKMGTAKEAGYAKDTGFAKDEIRVPLAEEQLRAEKHMEEVGKVRVTKDVITEQQQITVPVQKEVVRVERIPAGPRVARSRGTVTRPARRRAMEKASP